MRIAYRTIAGICLLLVAPYALGQSHKELQTRVVREAPEKWAEYRQRARTFQGQYKLTVTERHPKALKTVRIDKFKQAPEAALVERGHTVFLEGDPGPNSAGSELVWGQNTEYSFELERRDATSPWVAGALELRNKNLLRKLGKPVTEWSLVLVSQQFRGGLPIPLAEALSHKTFSLKGIHSTSSGKRQLARVDFEYQASDAPNPRSYRGWAILDPSNYWHITSCELTTTMKGYTGRYTVDYEFADGADGLPVITSSMGKVEGLTDNGAKQESTRLAAWDIREDRAVPVREFKLSAYGLPEPLEATGAGGQRYYFWFLAVAVGCFLSAGVFAYFRSRGCRAVQS